MSWSIDGTTLALSCGAVGGVMLALWLFSLTIRNASIVDIFWGPGFALIAWIHALAADERGVRTWVLVGCTTVWAVRLGGYLAWRNIGHGEDKRYVAMRKARGDSFWWRSLYIVFGFQAALMAVVAAPIYVGMLVPEPGGWTWATLIAGVVAWTIGFVFETVGDYQLARYKAQDERPPVMDRGLWRYTRHPNYFGDFMVWWGLALIALPDLAHGWIALGPAIMSFLLMRVSGVPMLEHTLRKRPAYAEYVARTSPFFPRRPRPRPGT